MGLLRRLVYLGFAFGLALTLAIAPPALQHRDPVVAQTNPLHQNIAQMEVGWQQEYETYLGSNFAFTEMNVNQMSQILADQAIATGERTAILWLISKPRQFSLALLTPDNPPIQRTTLVDIATVTQAKQDLFRGITSQNPLIKRSYFKSAQQFYDWLIRPIEATLELEKIDNLLFCPGVGLRAMPFAALHDGQKFLIEKYGVATVPAFQLMDQVSEPLGDRPVLAMGASHFSDLPDLPGVELELATITPNLRQGKSFLNEAFTLDTLQQERQQQDYGILHLATHAEFKRGAADQSFIQFADQRLGLDQMAALDWGEPPLALLVLSACRTALGDDQAELGFAGLALQAGVRAAIASLWYVSDAGSVALMGEFYRALNGGVSKVTALRQAQLAMLRNELTPPEPSLPQATRSAFEQITRAIDFTHPYYWAAYNLIGNPW